MFILLFVINNDDELVKSRKTPFFVIPAKAGIQFFNWLQSFWTPVFTGVTTFYETINDIREYQDEASWFFLQLITRQNNTYHLFLSSNKHAMPKYLSEPMVTVHRGVETPIAMCILCLNADIFSVLSLPKQS